MDRSFDKASRRRWTMAVPILRTALVRCRPVPLTGLISMGGSPGSGDGVLGLRRLLPRCIRSAILAKVCSCLLTVFVFALARPARIDEEFIAS